jgi:hypothetical protein
MRCQGRRIDIEELYKEGENPMEDLMREKLRIIRYSAVRCSNYVWFHISAAAGQKNGQLNRKRNFEKANNEYRMSNIEVMYSACREPVCRTVYFKKA